MHYPIGALLRGSHGLLSARRTLSSRPEGPKLARRPRLPVQYISFMYVYFKDKCFKNVLLTTNHIRDILLTIDYHRTNEFSDQTFSLICAIFSSCCKILRSCVRIVSSCSAILSSCLAIHSPSSSNLSIISDLNCSVKCSTVASILRSSIFAFNVSISLSCLVLFSSKVSPVQQETDV